MEGPDTVDRNGEDSYDSEIEKLKQQKQKLEQLEKKELGTLVKVIKNKKQIENKTKELTFSTAKNKSRVRKKYAKRKEGSIYSMDGRKLHKRRIDPKTPDLATITKASEHKKLVLPREDVTYTFIKVVEAQSSNK